jgi:hypothetical protein
MFVIRLNIKLLITPCPGRDYSNEFGVDPLLVLCLTNFFRDLQSGT